MLYNEPGNIYKPKLGLTHEQILRHELKNIQERIDLTKTRNGLVAKWLNRCRYAAIATPAIFAATAWMSASR